MCTEIMLSCRKWKRYRYTELSSTMVRTCSLSTARRRMLRSGKNILVVVSSAELSIIVFWRVEWSYPAGKTRPGIFASSSEPYCIKPSFTVVYHFRNCPDRQPLYKVGGVIIIVEWFFLFVVEFCCWAGENRTMERFFDLLLMYGHLYVIA